VANHQQALTAEELMRSRYTAFSVGAVDHLIRSWHPETCPADLTVEPGLTWTGLDVITTVDGGPLHKHGEVEFRASYVAAGGEGELHEHSTFTRVDGRWCYVGPRNSTP
jgi:SEC-C motif-containing protein